LGAAVTHLAVGIHRQAQLNEQQAQLNERQQRQQSLRQAREWGYDPQGFGNDYDDVDDVDDLDDVDNFDGVDEADDVDKLGKVNQVEDVDDVDEANEVDETDEADELDDMDDGDELDELDDVDETDEANIEGGELPDGDNENEEDFTGLDNYSFSTSRKSSVDPNLTIASPPFKSHHRRISNSTIDSSSCRSSKNLNIDFSNVETSNRKIKRDLLRFSMIAEENDGEEQNDEDTTVDGEECMDDDIDLSGNIVK